MKKLQHYETELVGKWVKAATGVDGDDVCKRIDWLTSEVLEEVGIEKDSGGWETLYRDPSDGRYWLLSYPKGEMQGGGPAALKNISPTSSELESRFVSPKKWKAEVAQDRLERNIRIIPPKKGED